MRSLRKTFFSHVSHDFFIINRIGRATFFEDRNERTFRKEEFTGFFYRQDKVENLDEKNRQSRIAWSSGAITYFPSLSLYVFVYLSID